MSVSKKCSTLERISAIFRYQMEIKFKLKKQNWFKKNYTKWIIWTYIFRRGIETNLVIISSFRFLCFGSLNNNKSTHRTTKVTLGWIWNDFAICLIDFMVLIIFFFIAFSIGLAWLLFKRESQLSDRGVLWLAFAFVA